MTISRLPVFFISHGGGPWPWMKEQFGSIFELLEQGLRLMPEQVGETPKSVLMISAHWEEPEFNVMSSARPTMLYDYLGFPEYTYRITYPAPGAPHVAERVSDLLKAAGLPVRLDAKRGFDHGMFAPMAVIYPEADVPVLQLSLKRGLDPREHLALGRAIAPLRDEGVLIIGSGLSYHNLNVFGPGAGNHAEEFAQSKIFDQWLQRTVVDATPADRAAGLIHWEHAPMARRAHPREEHLLPLMVAVGAAEGETAYLVYHENDFFGGVAVSNFMFGRPPR